MAPRWIFLFCALGWGSGALAAAPSPGDVPNQEAADEGLVDLNLASADELQRLPGVGPSTAAAIIRYRNTRGPFRRVNHLERVPGIGASTLEGLRPYARVGDLTEAREAIAKARAEDPGPTEPPIDINLATAAELTALPGIGPSKAEAIIEERERRGPFKRCRQLERIKGIGPSTVDQLLERCTATDPTR